MKHLSDSSSSSSSPGRRDDDEKVKPEILLDEAWFFGNLLDTNLRMPRCYSDPCPSSNYGMESLVVVKNSKFVGGVPPPNLIRMPSMPTAAASLEREATAMEPESESHSKEMKPSNLLRTSTLPICVGRGEDAAVGDDEEIDFALSTLIRQASLNDSDIFDQVKAKSSRPKKPMKNLLRTATLPTCLDREGDHDQESNFTHRKLVKQASINASDSLPPRYNSKTEVQNCSSRGKHRPQKKEGTNLRVNPNDFEFEGALRGPKELGLEQEKNQEEEEEWLRRRPNLSEAWAATQSKKSFAAAAAAATPPPPPPPPPPIPKDWSVAKKRSKEADMKAQIKFWARAVASNVRQEC